jgi:hypothetical protein
MAVLALILFSPMADASEKAFYGDIQGKWSGSGEIVAGKYKGTRFTCAFDGLVPDAVIGISVDGKCRIGVFAQPISAYIERAISGYAGSFMDGAQGDGMDVVGGRYTPSSIAVDIRRKDLHGVLVAKRSGEDRMSVTVSVRVQERLIPVIGMSLKRSGRGVDGTVTSSVNR